MPSSKIETEIVEDMKRLGATARSVTPEDVDNEILAETFHRFPGTTVCVCCLTLRNGFTVLGDAAAASPENYREEIAHKISRAKAREKIWPLLGFRLRDRLTAEADKSDFSTTMENRDGE